MIWRGIGRRAESLPDPKPWGGLRVSKRPHVDRQCDLIGCDGGAGDRRSAAAQTTCTAVSARMPRSALPPAVPRRDRQLRVASRSSQPTDERRMFIAYLTLTAGRPV
jgi:hypothetical protein